MIRHRLLQFRGYTQRLLQALFSPLVMFLVVTGNVVLLLCALALHHFEHPVNSGIRSVGDALWLAMTTVTTVGYGDIVPVTGIGRLIAALLMVLGNFFYLSFGAVLVSILFSQERDEMLRQERLTRVEVDRLIDEIRQLRAELGNH